MRNIQHLATWWDEAGILRQEIGFILQAVLAHSFPDVLKLFLLDLFPDILCLKQNVWLSSIELMEFRAVSCLTKQVVVGAHLSITRRTIVQLFVRKRYCNLDAPNPQVNFPRLTQFKLCTPAFLSPSVSKCNTAVDKCAPKIWTIAKSSRLRVRVDFQCLTICQSG